MEFPRLDPIPIPAPVWLMKVLSLLTMALHFFAVQVLIGSLVAVLILNYRVRKHSDPSAKTALSVIARRIPIVMTYVINLGVPPLLFLQVLYGRAIYTSTVLIAVMWLSIVFQLMAAYYLLYVVSDRASKGKSVGWQAFVALMLAAGIGQIYTMAMTLMLKPEAWPGMYAKTATGLQGIPHEVTMMPRWLFMMFGGLIAGGCWIALNSNLSTIETGTKKVLQKLGTQFTIAGVLVQIGFGFRVIAKQPLEIQQALSGSALNKVGTALWGICAVVTLIIAVLHLRKATPSLWLGWTAPVTTFLSIAGAVLVRDQIRDLTLASKGFDVFNRVESSNWFVIGLFLILFVAGLGTLGWLLSVMKRAKGNSEEVLA